MDYSLLLVISFNPNYTKKYPDKFYRIKEKPDSEGFEKEKEWKLIDKEVKEQHMDEVKRGFVDDLFNEGVEDVDKGDEEIPDYLQDKQVGGLNEDGKRELLKGYEDKRHVFMSEDGMYLYHMGVIDYLQDFNWIKWGENKYKSLKTDGDYISAVPPPWYAKRFIEFMCNNVLINQKYNSNTETSKPRSMARVLRYLKKQLALTFGSDMDREIAQI